ncbi:MAG: TonB-dependent receptor [Chitinophagaceae bacterium]|nr:TonB-dependent receptor [Chitinophagaceae bacterium]MCW5926953.1 TonB-dependent receptor [Chitinophagaceae bacterium]
MLKKISFIIFLFSAPVLLIAQSSQVKGTVINSDGSPAEAVSVQLEGKTIAAVTNASGDYILNNIQPGSWRIVVSGIGVRTQRRQITIAANEILTINFSLEKVSTDLEEILVNSRKNTEHASVSLRLKTPLLEVPQNIQVIDDNDLKAQQVISMSDGVVRNVSGAARLEHWGDLYTNVVARGSQLQAFRNGFNVVASYWGPLTEDMCFVDRIEFVKGPAGFMLSNGDPSGLYNVVTKKPTGVNKGEINFTTGSFSLYRAGLDLDGALSKNKKLLYRLNVAAQAKGSHRDHEYNNRYVIAPVVSYQVDDKTKITLEYNGQFANMTEVGSYYVFSPQGYATYPRNLTFTNPGLPPTKINDHSGYVIFEHSLDENWKLTAQGSYFNYQQRGMSSWPSMVDPDNGYILRNFGIWDASSSMVLGQAFLNGEFYTGKIRHRLLAGLDAANKTYYADWGQSYNLDTPDDLFDPLNPGYGIPPNGYPVFDRSTPIQQRAILGWGVMKQQYTSLYVQDELAFLQDRLRLTLAGRYTDVKQVYGVDQPYDAAKHFTPRAGLSFSIDPNTSVYGLYDQAFIPQTGILTNGGKVQPVTGNNLELGIKRNWFKNKWNTTLSVYRILKQNELTADPASNPNAPTSIVLGEKIAKGVELDVRGSILPGFTVMANYAYTDARVTKVAAGVTEYKEDQIVPGFARHTANAWVSYELQKTAFKGLGVSGGFTMLNDRFTAWSLEGKQPEDYFKLDGGIFYARNKYRITLNVFNILDAYLYSGSYYAMPTVAGDWSSTGPAYYYQTEPPRNVRLSIAYRF